MAINQRTLYGIQGGLNAPEGQGFLGGLMSGLSGTLGGFARYTDLTHEQERQRIRDMIEERRLRIAESQLEEQRQYHAARYGGQRTQGQPSAANAPVIYGATTPEGDTQPVDVGQHFGVSTPALKRAMDRQGVSSLFPARPKTDALSLWLQKREYAEKDKRRLDIEERVQGINEMNAMDPNDRAILNKIVNNPGSQEEREAAERKIRGSMNWVAQPTR